MATATVERRLGAAQLAILAALAERLRPTYATALGDATGLRSGSLYPALESLVRRQLIRRSAGQALSAAPGSFHLEQRSCFEITEHGVRAFAADYARLANERRTERSRRGEPRDVPLLA